MFASKEPTVRSTVKRLESLVVLSCFQLRIQKFCNINIFEQGMVE